MSKSSSPSGVLAFPNGKHSVPFGSVLRKYRIASGVSQTRMAEIMGVTRNGYICWESGKNRPSIDQLAYLCSYFDIPLWEALGFPDPVSLSRDEKALLQGYRQLSIYGKRVAAGMVSTLLSEEAHRKEDQAQEAARKAREKILADSSRLLALWQTKAAAGTGNEFIAYEKPACRFYRETPGNHLADGIVEVDGHSMEPAYYPQDHLYFKTTPSASPGEDVVARVGSRLVVKRVGSDGRLYSVNTDPRYTFLPDEDVQVIGRITGIVHEEDWLTDEENELLSTVLLPGQVAEFEKQYQID